jgi:hypothetical protein
MFFRGNYFILIIFYSKSTLAEFSCDSFIGDLILFLTYSVNYMAMKGRRIKITPFNYRVIRLITHVDSIHPERTFTNEPTNRFNKIQLEIKKIHQTYAKTKTSIQPYQTFNISSD